jgi:DNA polymerase-3 subunit gamma/tau
VAEIPDWGRLLKELNLKGISRELARHCELQSYQGQELALVLDEGYRQLRNERAVERLQEALRKQLANPRLRLRISVQGTLSATPARRQQEQESAQRAAAEQAIENDPNVQALRERFGASIRPGSITPR